MWRRARGAGRSRGLDVLAAHADPEEIGGGNVALGRVLGATLDCRLDSSEACRVDDELERGDERFGAFDTAMDPEGEHEARTCHRLRALVVGVRSQPRVADVVDRGMFAEALR
jgi:hypothetical protein